MGYRISGHDLTTGRPCAPYETAAATEAQARAEAERLGIRVQSIEAIETLSARRRADDVALMEWDWPVLQWRTRRFALLRLGLEHPRWGRVLQVTALLSFVLVRSKIVPAMLVTLGGAGLAALGMHADPTLLTFVLAIALLVLPVLLVKPWVFRRLARQHADDGFDRPRRLSVDKGEIRWFDGRTQRVLPANSIARVHQLPHSVLIGLREGGEIAVPAHLFDNAGWARRFAQLLARSSAIEPRLGFRSAWLGPDPEQTPLAKTLLTVMPIIAIVAVLLVVLIFWRR